jgi:hypothetical protein
VDGRNKSGHDDPKPHTRSTRSIISSRGTAMGAVAGDEDFESCALERVTLGDTVDFLLYRAGIGVDINGDEFRHG